MLYFMGGGYSYNGYIREVGITDGFFLETFFSFKNDVGDGKLQKVLEVSDKVIIDSGAFTFMNSGTNMTELDMDNYFEMYYQFIKRNKDNPKIIGFFELDVDRVFGVDKALEYLKKLTELTDKVIPVWHNTRPISFYYEMCKNYKRVAFTQAILSDVYPGQVNLFVNVAHKYGANVHLLGFARFNLLKDLNLNINDSFDAVSYCMNGAFCTIKLLSNNLDKQYTFDFSELDDLNTANLSKINTLYHHMIQKKLEFQDNSKEGSVISL